MEKYDLESILEMYDDDYQKVAEVPRSEMDNFNTPDLEQAPDSYLRPGETLEDFDVTFRRPNAQGGRIPFAKAKSVQKIKGKNKGTTKSFYDESTGHIYPRKNRFGTFYSDTPVGGKRRNIITEEIGEEIIEKFRKGFSSVELEEQYGIDNDTILRYVKNKEPNIKVAKKDKRRVNQYNFDKSVIDEIIADAPNMSRKMILEKYGDRISKKKLDSLNLTFGVVEESGRPRIPEGERSPKQVKRANRIKNVQGFDVSGTFAKNFHHIFPITDNPITNFSAQDVMILDKKFNELLGAEFNLRLNDIADEIGSMDLSDPNALKKLNDLNAESKMLVDKAKAKLPKELQNIIGYIEYNPVFDENGTIIELSQIRKGVDEPMGALPAEFGNKKFKDYTPEEIKKFKTRVKQLALQAGDEGTMFAANVIPKKLLTKTLGDMAISLSSPTALVGLNTYLGIDPTESLDRAIVGAEAALAPSGIKALMSRLDAIKNPTVRKGIETVAGLRLPGVFTPANVLKAARFASPLGIATLAGEGLYQLGKLGYEDQQRFNALSPEEQAAERAEQEAFARSIGGA